MLKWSKCGWRESQKEELVHETCARETVYNFTELLWNCWAHLVWGMSSLKPNKLDTARSRTRWDSWQLWAELELLCEASPSKWWWGQSVAGIFG